MQIDEESILSGKKIQVELSEVEADLTLRRLLWESLQEWDKLSSEWESCVFQNLDVEQVQKDVHRFSQTVYLLQKGTHTFTDNDF